MLGRTWTDRPTGRMSRQIDGRVDGRLVGLTERQAERDGSNVTTFVAPDTKEPQESGYDSRVGRPTLAGVSLHSARKNGGTQTAWHGG